MNEKNQRLILFGIILAIISAFAVFVLLAVVFIPDMTTRLFGEKDPALDNASRILYSMKLYLNRESLFTPYSSEGPDRVFVINTGDTAKEVVENLAKEKLIKDPEIFTDYLVYKGIDRLLLAGTYLINPALKPIDIAASLYDSNPQDITFSFLAGWRAEEIAALLPSSGLNISVDEFLKLVHNPPKFLSSLISPDAVSLEGFLFPGNYQVMKSGTAEDMIKQILMNFKSQLPRNHKESLNIIDMSLEQVIILASLVEKEAILSDEAPLIASVFINRLKEGVPLQSDPTVQYALGYSADQKTWWKNPLTAEDLEINSQYNTYLYQGLPPAPISNPGIISIMSVLNPADSDFLFFRAACDGSGKHIFSSTYENHLKAACE